MAELNHNNKDITYFAETDFRGKKTPFGVKIKDRARHVYVIGKTGMGKSTMLENMAIQDIRNGNGMGFLDPHGSSAEALLNFVPAERIKDVVYFAPFDLDHPISFNIMEDVGRDKRHLVANGLLASFKKIWPDVWSARMEYILNNTILALLEYPNSTLLGVNRMLSDKVYRNRVVDNITDPSVRSFWVDEFAKYNERYMQEAGDAIKNKIGQFTSNPLIRNIIGQPKSSFDIRRLMDEKKILIVNLSKGRVGEQNANLLGGMLITKIYLAAMSRANLSDSEIKEVPPFFLFVDEFQSFVNDSFADILAEARKYKLNLTIAHQYIDQMPETVRSAVFGNVGTTVTFRVGPFDAEVLETIFMPKFTKEDLVNLGFAQVYMTLMIDGVGSAPFSAVTLPPYVNIFPSVKDQIIEESRSQFSRGRLEVEEVINRWHEEQRAEMDAGGPSRPMQSRPGGNRYGGPERPAPRPMTPPPSKINIPAEIREAVAEIKRPEPVNEPKPSPAPVVPPISVAPIKPPEPKIDTVAQKESPRGPIAPLIDAAKNGEKKLPLSALSQKNQNHKGGSSANKSELRQALSELIGQDIKEKKEDHGSQPKTQSSVADGRNAGEVSKDQQKEVKKEEKLSGAPPRPTEKKPEVPEDVLRKMLKMDGEDLPNPKP